MAATRLESHLDTQTCLSSLVLQSQVVVEESQQSSVSSPQQSTMSSPQQST